MVYNRINNKNNNNKDNRDITNSSTPAAITAARITCPNCKNNRLITDTESDEIICSKCGQVISGNNIQEINNLPEWRTSFRDRANNNNRGSSRGTGTPTSLARHDMGLSTIIGRADKDASGRILDSAMHSKMERLRLWDFRTQASGTNRNLKNAFEYLDKLKDKLGLPDAAIEKTAYIYRKAQERGLIRGRTIPVMLAAAVYIACREIGIPRSLSDIATITNVRRKELARTYRLLIIELDHKVPMIDPIKCVAKVANKASLKEITKRKAINIVHEATKKELSAGKDPMSLAATVLYLSSLKTGEKRTQQDISNAAGVTSMTLRNRLKDLKSQLKLNN